MEAKTKDLWVFVETKEDGSAKNVGIELLAPGRDIANKQGGSLVALVVGETLTTLSLVGGAIVFVSVMTYNVLTVKLEKQNQGELPQPIGPEGPQG